MKSTNILPYGLLNQDDWTVNSLQVVETLDQREGMILSDLVSINQNRMGDIANENKNLKYIRVRNIDQDTQLISHFEKLTFEELPKRAKLLASENDILLAKTRPDKGSIAIIGETDEKYVVSNTLSVLNCKSSFSPALVFFILSSDTVMKELKLLARGSTVPTLSIEQLTTYKLPLNEYPSDQEEKAEELLEKWININNRSKSITDIAEDIFKESLLKSDLNSNDSSVQSYAIKNYNKISQFLDPRHYLTDDEEKVKWNCSVRKLKDLISFRSIRSKPYKNEHFTEKIPFLKVGNLDETSIMTNIEEVEFKKCINEGNGNDYLCQGDIVLSKMSGQINRSNLVSEDLAGGIANQYIYVLEAIDINPEYLVLFLKTKWAKDQVDLHKSTVNKKDIGSMEVPLPKSKVQEKIVNKVKQRMLGDKKEELKEEIEEFKTNILNKN